jgi:hypothetical protein
LKEQALQKVQPQAKRRRFRPTDMLLRFPEHV